VSGTIVLRRGEVVESRHRVHVAVADPEGRLLARTGDPWLVTHFRSAAKPLQALPLVEDGAVEAFGIPIEELALACASHNGEEGHVTGVRRLLEWVGVAEEALELGPHLPMLEAAAHALLRSGGEALPVHNNCSGKHAGMLGLARHRGWPLEGYRLPDHPVQQRMTKEVARWTGVEAGEIRPGVDGCGVVCFGVPIAAMARSFAGLGRAAVRGDEGPARVVEAMTAHPFQVAGTGRLCTELMEATGGAIFAKVGAEGVYAAGDRDGSLGVAIKVEDGSRRAVEVALVRVLEELSLVDDETLEALESYRRRPVPNTLGEEAAFLEVEGGLLDRGRLGHRGGAGKAADPGWTPETAVGADPSTSEPALSPHVRSLVRVSGAAATRNPVRIRAVLEEAAVEAGTSEVEEALVQAYLFLGFPGALNAMALWREVQGARSGRGARTEDRAPGPGDIRSSGHDEDGTGSGRSGEDPASWEAWASRGEEVCRRVYGDRYRALRRNIRSLHPDLDRWMIREGYGKVLGRPGLDLKVRELCIVGLLAVLDAPVQLYSHLRGTLAVGASPLEVDGALAAVEDLMDPGARERAREQWERVRSRRMREGDGHEDATTGGGR
jgi:L-asparaginase II/alkylhydroperoxidase/carboxymuconolactone decarboxylase family protein YurZ